MSGSYRVQAVFGDDALADAAAAYDRWKTFNEACVHLLGDDFPSEAWPATRDDDSLATAPGYIVRFVEAMDDDLNSAGAYAVVHDLVREGNKLLEAAQRGDTDKRKELIEIAGTFVELIGVLGFRFPTGAEGSELVGDLLDYLLELREQARSEKAFERADAIRDRLNRLGIAIEDTAAGTRWRIGS
jgi:cysteinyl-tRNA synthetase